MLLLGDCMIRNLNEADMQIRAQADEPICSIRKRSSHNLWIRFKNYKDNPPLLTLQTNYHPVCMITKLKREPYANLYEIFAVHPGYATNLWDIMAHMKANGVERLKMSCTPSSIGWHKRNGIVGWAIDPSGSIRVDVPICETQEEQLALRERAIDNPWLVMPPERKSIQLRAEHNSFGKIKQPKVDQAIDTLGDFWLRKYLPK